jgi:hypothetical protein
MNTFVEGDSKPPKSRFFHFINENDYGLTKQNHSLHWELEHCTHGSLCSMGEMMGDHHFLRGRE